MDNELGFLDYGDCTSLTTVNIHKCDILEKHLKKHDVTLENIEVTIENNLNEEQIDLSEYISDSDVFFTEIIRNTIAIEDLIDFVKQNEKEINAQIDAVIYIVNQISGEPPCVIRCEFKNNTVKVFKRDLADFDIEELVELCGPEIETALDKGMGILFLGDLSTSELDEIIDCAD